MASTDQQFSQAAQHWDLETLYADLASAKGKRLTPVEKLHLRGLLCSYSPSEIAEQLGKNVNGVETDLCASIYRYVKSLVNKCNEKVENWRNIAEWLEEAGYKTQSSATVDANQLLPEKSIVNITKINIEQNQLVIDINLRIPTAQDAEQLVQDLNFKNGIDT
ncbi:helix-turn-helix domain-containing protein [Lyngbya sp. CCY1209]|uniref:helix-turn-helix domain-containing protein n=1 Tax=Lyngbya sp. CCY1209 TaxID=2886103 RepID=UPI002D20C88B|nr:helix-turn-helix domain-containing protein [Lyngbya sp. CCY1209]MEB3883203.1 helix-turn-helix domain-containing protein [Lyngbya sp. CCY1209]